MVMPAVCACARTCVGAAIANAATAITEVPKYNACLIVIFRSVIASGPPDCLEVQMLATNAPLSKAVAGGIERRSASHRARSPRTISVIVAAEKSAPQNLRPVVGLRPTIHKCDFSQRDTAPQADRLINIIAVQRRFSLMQETSASLDLVGETNLCLKGLHSAKSARQSFSERILKEMTGK